MRWLAVCLVLFAPCFAVAKPTPFDAGRVRISLGSGFGVYQSSGYVAVGLGVGYYVIDGLELSMQVEHWFGSHPTVTRVAPGVTYTFHQLDVLPPYIGGFYRHWFVGGGRADLDTVGGRAGAYLFTGRAALVGLGAAYERVVSRCRGDCDVVYPELIVAGSF